MAGEAWSNVKTVILSKKEEVLEPVGEAFAFLFGRHATLAGLLADLVAAFGDACVEVFVVLPFCEQDLLQVEVVVLVVFDLLVQRNFDALLL
jgi:hypothetical protein